ncbi:MAG: magnesium transporter [Polaribacter sp.]|jgi:magnesium transporter|uniref:magnesium transporter n=1 Tax=Polaribacter sp. TaxID=1920175 RepID=UPI00261A18CB|nr:magnesium transporter [Polaribacter sp.]MBT3740895.1 magnesium transporter [Polaribacter sp.]MBT4413882.1 magnesium transporter [Polaribacter sp.]MBT7817412.1 magnesium transporter [Polaribacter sp.]MDG1195321.1 magnesium transporter [Polaribacter sp.]MDG1403956.1 magnesium transporter [Polaribacter sp.]
MAFEITNQFLEKLVGFIYENNDSKIKNLFSEVHYADIAEVLDEVSFDEAIYIIKLLDSEKTSEILTELDEDTREKILENLSAKEIAEEIEEMDSDDAADIIGELSEERQNRVINAIEDDELAADIKELLSYNDDSAGSLMAKELVKVYETWTVAGCLRRIRAQAKEVSRVHSIYVVDKQEKLIGRLSLKDLIVAKNEQKISEIYINKVDSVNVNEDDEEVAKIMVKYDLEAIPVVDDANVLLGRITIDDIVDLLKEEADKDYQLAAGLTQDVDSDDSILDLTRARLPWLFLGLVGGVGAFIIMEGFQGVFTKYATLFFFTPLIAAMAGNVGVQSSAIIVQGLANDDVKGSINSRLFKEMLLAALNGVILALFLFLFVWIYEGKIDLALAISASLVVVIIIAGLIGTFVPLFLNKRGIDPAIATGPFITTSNDIFGILIYFLIAKLILGI